MLTVHDLKRAEDGDEAVPLDKRGPADYPEGDDRSPEDYARYSRALWDEQEAPLEYLHHTWIQNILFLAGHQWWRFNSRRGTWGPEKVPEWREQPVSNLCLPYFKHFLAKVTKDRPAFTAIAASTDPEDVQAAKLGEDVLEAKWTELRLSRALRRAIAWVIPTGNAYLYPYWNTDTGKLRALTMPVEAGKFDEHGMMVGAEVVECPCDEHGEPKMTAGPDGSPVYDLESEPAYIDEGEVACRVLSPFQVRVDPSAECDEDVTWTLIAEVLPLREIRRRWPERSAKVTAEDVGVLDQYDNLVSGVMNGEPDTQMISGQTARDEDIPKALVLHYHEKPCPEYPGGRYWVTAGEELLEDPQTLPENIWPCVIHLKDIEVPGRYHAMATMEAVVGLNREYNETNALIKEHHNLLLRGKWLVPIGSNIRRGMITQMPGEVIQHTPGMPPKQADLKPLPAAVYNERERILQDFQTISGINKASMGQAPTGVTSGKAFLTLQEADDSDLGPFLTMLEECVAELAWDFLTIIQQRYEDERLIYVAGENRRYQVKSFKGADLTGVVDIVPQTGSAFPWSKTARQSMLIEIAQAMPDLFADDATGQFDKAKFAKLLPIAGLEALYHDTDEDVQEALREEEQFEFYAGEPGVVLPEPMPWQNLLVHDRQHTSTLKSAAFSKWHPAAQQAFLAHWRATRSAIQQQVMQQMAMAQAGEDDDSGGAAGGGPSAN